jgi:hypothetical protein
VSDLARGRPTQVSSVEPGSNLVGGNTVDDSDVTRWASAQADPSWLSVDLGASYAISQVRLSWETAYGKAYQIQTSGECWKPALGPAAWQQIKEYCAQDTIR